MSDNPGVSLFQGSEELQIETNTQRLEEEEALEDERRRQAEIENAIATAFEDLEDEDELKTSDSSGSESPNQYDAETYFEPYFGRNSGKNGHQLPEARPFVNGGRRINEFQKIIDNSHLYTNVHSPSEQHQVRKHHLENGHRSPESPTTDKGQHDPDSVHHPTYNQNYRTGDITEKQLEVLYDIRLKEIDRLQNEISSMKHEFEAEKVMLVRKATLMEAEKEKAVIARNSAQELLVESKDKIANFGKEIETLRFNLKNTEQSKRELSKELEKSLLTVGDLQRRLKTIESLNRNKNDEKQMDNIVKSLKSQHEQELSGLQRKYESIKQELDAKKKDISKLQRTVEDVENKYTNMLLEKSEMINKLNCNLEKSQSQCQQLMTSSMSSDSVYLQKLLDQTTNEKKELEQKVQNLKCECDMLRSDLLTYENSVKYGMVQFDLSKQDKNDSIELLGLVPGENNYFGSNESNPMRKYQPEFQRLMNANKTKRHKISQLESKLSAAEDKIDNLKQEEAKYVTQNKSLMENINKLTQHINSKDKEWQEKENQSEKISLYETQLGEKEAEIQRLKEEIKSIRLDLEMKSMELETQKSKTSSDHFARQDEAISRINQEVSFQKEKKIKQLELELDQVRKDLDEVKELYINACNDKKTLLEDKQKCLKQIGEFAAEKEDLMRKLESFSTEKKRLLQQIEELTVNKTKLSKRVQFAENEMETKYKERMEEMEKSHEHALKEVREQVKEQTISYFATQMAKLEDSYRARHSHEVLEQKKMEAVLTQKFKEIEELKALANELKQQKRTVETTLKNRIEELTNQIDGEREKAAEFLSNWTKEISEMQNETKELNAELERFRSKYQSMKKAALVYKERAEHFEKRCKEGHESLKKSSELIEQKYQAIINQKESEIEEKLIMLEKVYQTDAVKFSNKSKNNTELNGDNIVTNDG